MSYLDGRNVPGSNSPYTVWLLSGSFKVIGIDYHELNYMIDEYNRAGLARFVDFWPWFSTEYFNNDDQVTGFSALWNDHNINMNQVHMIKGERRE